MQTMPRDVKEPDISALLNPDDDLTIMDSPAAAVLTARGQVLNEAWSRMEVTRLHRHGLRAYIRRNGGGRIAVNVPRF